MNMNEVLANAPVVRAARSARYGHKLHPNDDDQ